MMALPPSTRCFHFMTKIAASALAINLSYWHSRQWEVKKEEMESVFIPFGDATQKFICYFHHLLQLAKT